MIGPAPDDRVYLISGVIHRAVEDQPVTCCAVEVNDRASLAGYQALGRLCRDEDCFGAQYEARTRVADDDPYGLFAVAEALNASAYVRLAAQRSRR